jgi:hypothetical protein
MMMRDERAFFKSILLWVMCANDPPQDITGWGTGAAGPSASGEWGFAAAAEMSPM